ncbi:MAG: hypothetical protein K9N49_02665 [Candidatus Marinimicrobia bacterium]|nr:hypothetical protein [Candidatus Neomarinimicrobiota bacterium]
MRINKPEMRNIGVELGWRGAYALYNGLHSFELEQEAEGIMIKAARVSPFTILAGRGGRIGWLVLAGWVTAAVAAPGQPTVVHVQPGQTLNAAIADVAGPVMILLPPGVTEHDAAITRNETVIIRGAGEAVTTLRPAAALGPDDGVALVTQTEGYDGDFILEELTYDRAHHPGVTPGDPAVRTGANILLVSAQNRVVLCNVSIHHFDYGAREGEANAGTPFVFTEVVASTADLGVYRFHTRDMEFRNVTIDFEKGGGIRHRPGRPHDTFQFGTVDRILIDADCVFRSHLCQDANPAYTVGPVWNNRGNAGPMYGIRLWVYERALIDGVWHNSDYGAWRNGGPASTDAVLEWRMDLLNAGYGDQFWQGPGRYGRPVRFDAPAGHMIFKDVRIEGNRTGKLWNDYGLRAFGDWKRITVEDCTVLNRGHTLMFGRGRHLGDVTIRNVTLAPSANGREAILIRNYERIDSLEIDNVTIMADPGEEQAYYTTGIRIQDVKSAGPITIRNVRAEGFLQHAFDDQTGPEVTVVTSNIVGRQTAFTLPEGFDFALMPRRVGNPRNPRPDYHYGTEMPGYFQGAEVLTPVSGDATIAWGMINLSYTREAFHLYVSFQRDEISPLAGDDFSTADRLRIGLALGAPDAVATWYEIEVAAAEGADSEPLSQARARLRRYPGGEEVALGGIEVGRLERKGQRWGVTIPWAAVGIDPIEESFFIDRRLCVDLAYIDVDAGREVARYQFMGRSGILADKHIQGFKQVFLRDVDWDDSPPQPGL